MSSYSARHCIVEHHLEEFAPEATEATTGPRKLQPTAAEPLAPPTEATLPLRETSKRTLPLDALCALDAFRSCGLECLDTSSLLRLSEVDRWTHEEAVAADLFQPDVCVHCGKAFSPLENRAQTCVPIKNKRHRRHKGERAANARERRNRRALIEQRKRIARGEKWILGDDRYASCDRCGARYPRFRVPDDAWREAVPEHEQDASLCMACYLGEPRWDRRAALFVAGLVAAIVAALRRAMSCWGSEHGP